MKIRITTKGHETRVTHAETGELVENVGRVTWSKTPGDSPVAHIEIFEPAVDIVTDATVELTAAPEVLPEEIES